MIIPEKVINYIQKFHKHDFYTLLTPIVMYIRGEHFNPAVLKGDTLQAYHTAIKMLKPILRRRENARKRRKQLKEKRQAQQKAGIQTKDKKEFRLERSHLKFLRTEVDQYLINPEILDQIRDICHTYMPTTHQTFRHNVRELRRNFLKHFGKYFSNITYDPRRRRFRLYW